MAPVLLFFFSLRKLSLLPAAFASLLAAGAAFGTFDLTRRVAETQLPTRKPRPGSRLVAGATSLTAATFLVAAREALFAPPPPRSSSPWRGCRLFSDCAARRCSRGTRCATTRTGSAS